MVTEDLVTFAISIETIRRFTPNKPYNIGQMVMIDMDTHLITKWLLEYHNYWTDGHRKFEHIWTGSTSPIKYWTNGHIIYGQTHFQRDH